MKKILFTLCLLLGATTLSAQSHQTSDINPQTSDRMAAYREAIGLDMSVPDFSTKKIDAKVMGTRLAGILEYLLENIHQVIYESYFARILSEQHEALQNKFFNIKKIKLVSAEKKDNEITIQMMVSPDKNIQNIKQAELKIHFINGVSENRTTNEMFATMSRYVQAREQLDKQ
jgi:hypothetical protein